MKASTTNPSTARAPASTVPVMPLDATPLAHLHPEYASAFTCIGSACEDNCCRGWSVPVDRGTFEKYRSTPKLKPFVGTLIVLNTTSSSASDYARMPLTQDGGCGFLTEERLCGIQQKFGPEMLSVTCATYPRAVQPNPAQPGFTAHDVSLNLSCPEAARLVLLHPALLGATPWPLRLLHAYTAMWQQDGRNFGHGQARLAVRDFVLTLLSDRRYPLWQRLYLIGPVVRRLKTLAAGLPLAPWCDANPIIVAHVLGESARTAAAQRLRPVMDELEAQPAEQLQLIAEVLRLRLQQPPTPSRFIECIAEYEKGLGTDTFRTEQELLTAYAEGQRYLNSLLEDHPQLIENYLINHVFKNTFPFGRQPIRAGAVLTTQSDPEAEYALLCILATLTQTLLIGMAAHHREAFGVDHVVKLVQSLAKAIEHGTTFPARLAEFVQQRRPDAVLTRSATPPPHPANSSPAPTRPQPSPAHLPQTFPSPSLPAHSAP